MGTHTFSFNEIMGIKSSMTKKIMINPYNKKMELMLTDSIARMVLRYEAIEQTNDQVTFTVRTRDFEERGFKSLKILRNRSLGEFVPLYETEK